MSILRQSQLPPPPPPPKLSSLSFSSFRNPSNVDNGQLCWPWMIFFLTSPLRPHPSTAPLLLRPLPRHPALHASPPPSLPLRRHPPPPSPLGPHLLYAPYALPPSPPSPSTPPHPPPPHQFSPFPLRPRVKTLHDHFCRSLLNANCTNKNKTRKDRETSWFNCSTESEAVKLNQSKYSVYFRFCFVFLSLPPPPPPLTRKWESHVPWFNEGLKGKKITYFGEEKQAKSLGLGAHDQQNVFRYSVWQHLKTFFNKLCDYRPRRLHVQTKNAAPRQLDLFFFLSFCCCWASVQPLIHSSCDFQHS